MYDKLVFYCSYGSGDVHESREFIKDYMSKIPAREYYYAHGRGAHLLKDIDNLTYIQGTEGLDNRKAWEIKDNCLYINTWIGRDPKYVLPQVGCVIEKFYEMHSEISQELGIGPLRSDIYSYIPNINFEKLLGETSSEVRQFNSLDGIKILICNPQVHSNQAYNFDFTPIIKELCINYPKVNFFVTESINEEFPNLYSVRQFDHNAVAYLSTFCNIIVGRKSGSHTFCQHLENWIDPNKICISFTYARHSGHFVWSNHLPMKKVWSPAIEADEIFKVIAKEIEDVN